MNHSFIVHGLDDPAYLTDIQDLKAIYNVTHPRVIRQRIVHYVTGLRVSGAITTDTNQLATGIVLQLMEEEGIPKNLTPDGQLAVSQLVFECLAANGFSCDVASADMQLVQNILKNKAAEATEATETATTEAKDQVVVEVMEAVDQAGAMAGPGNESPKVVYPSLSPLMRATFGYDAVGMQAPAKLDSTTHLLHLPGLSTQFPNMSLKGGLKAAEAFDYLCEGIAALAHAANDIDEPAITKKMMEKVIEFGMAVVDKPAGENAAAQE